MAIWHIRFFPPAGRRHSPYDYIINLPKEEDRGQIAHRFKVLRNMEIGDWPNTWIHKINAKIYQLSAGDHRIMYCLDNREIIILHACRKVKRKTHKKDIARAEAHYNDYMIQKEGR